MRKGGCENAEKSLLETELTFLLQPYIPLSLHNAPRFGMPRSYLALFGPQRNQYIFGLLFAAVLITAFFVAWTVALVVLKCLGGEKVGFWSGRPFRIKFDLGTHDLLLKEQASADLEQDQQPEDSEGDKLPTLVRGVSLLSGTLEDGRLVVEERKDEEERTSHVADDENEDVGAPEFQLPSRRRETIIRSIFLLAGCLYLVFSVLVVTKGLARLQTTVEILSSITDQINYTIALLLHLCSKGLQEIADLTATLREQAAEELSTGSCCPRNPNLDKTSFGQELFRETTQAFNDLETLQDFLDTQVGPVSSGLLQAGKFITAANTAIRQIDLTSWQAMLALIPFSLLPTLLMAGAILAAFDATMRWYSWLINWLFVPLFWFVTTLAWIVSALMFMGGAVNGDFCLPGGRVEGAEPYWQPPDESVIRLLLAIGMNRNSTEYDIASYYVTQCFAPETTGPFQAISELIPRLVSTCYSFLLVHQDNAHTFQRHKHPQSCKRRTRTCRTQRAC